MLEPATPGYSFYLSPSCANTSCFQPGLKTALDSYDGNPKKGRFVVAETACFGCSTVAQWEGYFHAVFNNSAGPVQYMRYYNVEPFLAATGSVEGLRNFVNGWRKEAAKTDDAQLASGKMISWWYAAETEASWKALLRQIDQPARLPLVSSLMS